MGGGLNMFIVDYKEQNNGRSFDDLKKECQYCCREIDR